MTGRLTEEVMAVAKARGVNTAAVEVRRSPMKSADNGRDDEMGGVCGASPPGDPRGP